MSLLATTFSPWARGNALEATWQSADPQALTPQQVDWVLHNGSMTQHLRRHCQQLQVKIGFQGIVTLDQLAAAEQIPLPPGECSLWLREVILCGDGEPWIYARTLIPLSMLEHQGIDLRAIGETPIGELLFRAPGIERRELQHSWVCLPLAVAQALSLSARSPLLARRSSLCHGPQYLSVTEVFLPSAPVYQRERSSC